MSADAFDDEQVTLPESLRHRRVELRAPYMKLREEHELQLAAGDTEAGG
ncbi:hypothetical protein [Paractinoplanes rishiriensis]|uniref:Uncharacterized protein n=1 Tax=Paractinoplanes rishiriensis TaxID=1050105 RepID=A0A919K9L8_9ACTN|nr:hypothetical protein [Actinoplanes rishiriensis]GIF01958.1 hypothetical protein Ari01nite_94220 [Actinoplanes rishiriensis]